jgi:hypothetical protein
MNKGEKNGLRLVQIGMGALDYDDGLIRLYKGL